LITRTQFDSATIAISDVVSASGVITGGQTISLLTRDFISISGIPYSRVQISAAGNGSSTAGSGNDVSVTVTSAISIQYARALSATRSDFIVPQSQITNSGILTSDRLSATTVLTGGQTIQQITNNFVTVGSVVYARITMSANANANSASGSGNNITVTVGAAGTASTYNGNFVFFTGTSFVTSAATVGTRVDTEDTKFPAGTAIASISTRTFGSTTVYRVTFSQSSSEAINAAATVSFQFGAAYALPGETVFSFIANPGETQSLSLESLKELTSSAIGGRGTFPNGPDVLAINVYKISGAAVSSSIILRWGEAQA
jgi:hypothetical protein